MISCILILSLFLNPAFAAPGGGSADAARAAFEAGNYSAALKTATTALSSTPQDPALHYWALRSYYELRDYEKAVVHGETAVKLDPQNAEYNRWLGRAYGGKAEESHSFFLARKVKQAFEAAVHLAPTDIPARRDLMQFFAEAPWIVGGDKQKAKEQVEAISKMDTAEGHRARADFFAADKKWKEAEAEYLLAVDAHPRDIDAYMAAAEFFEGRRDARQIDRVLDAARRVDPMDPRVGYYSAVSLILQHNEPKTAERLLQAYLADVPQRSDYPSHKSAQEWLNRIGR
jgi:tetratricopeptide (TPR) repeat protein